MNASPAEIALCCGTKCCRGTPGAGPCAAAVYGRAIARRAKDAGFVVVDVTEVGRLRSALMGIANWCEAYPDTVFTEEASASALAACKAAGIPTGAMHGTWGRRLLAGIGPERPDVLELDAGPSRINVRAAHIEGVALQIAGYAAHLKPAQIDQLITWLQGHREDNP